MEKTLTADGHTFRVEQDAVDVTSNAPRRDKDWREIDPSGHEHYMQDGGYPTLEWVVTGGYWCEMHNEEHEEGEWRCRQCGEPVSPGMLPPSGHVETVPGMRRYYIDDKPVDGETFEAAIAKFRPET